MPITPFSRRHLLARGAAFSAGFAGLRTLMGASGSSMAMACEQLGDPSIGYGPLVEDPHRILDLPEGFTYRVIGRRGDLMTDGFFLPGQPDAMAAFPGPDADTTIIVRNHELAPDARQWSAFGEKLQLLDKLPHERIYDRGGGKVPACGGTTTVVYDTRRHKVLKQFLSLAGTINNCAGGMTPWGTWLSCEEDVTTPGNGIEQVHGYVFEVPASTAMEVTIPRPIKAMGRFRHEACAIDPASGVVFLTEDREDGLLYRFIPSDRTNLHAGGRLQALKVKDRASLDTSNTGAAPAVRRGEPMPVEWMDIDEIDSPKDDLRHRGFAQGAAKFARNEGMWYGRNAVFFAATIGGKALKGQAWRYTPSPAEGTMAEADSPGMLELFVEPNDGSVIENADNVTVAPWGDLMLCEDEVGNGDGSNSIVGVTPGGRIYRFARNSGSNSEIAGACFSPDGSTLFLNIQTDGLTLAVKGPWRT
ncbi:MAG: alkaline phosphatase PhoX [Phycisphaerae bacterium]